MALPELTAEGCASRRARLWASVPAECELAVIADPRHVAYFSNYAPSLFTFHANEALAILVLTRDRTALVVDNLVTCFADRAHVDEVVAPVWYEGKKSAPIRPALAIQRAIELIRGMGASSIGIEKDAVPSGLALALLEGSTRLRVHEIGPTIRRMRRRKDADEIAILRRSIELGEVAMRSLRAKARAGRTEIEVRRRIGEAVEEAAGEPVVLYGDFVSGPRCLERGGPPSDRTIERGDLFLLDCSVVVGGYRGDFANTVCVDAEPTKDQKALAQACMKTIDAMEGLLRPGASCRAIDAAMRAALPHASPSHGGHGLGLGHPEPPFIVPESDDTLEEGDVVACEPGQYVPGVGGMRFERNYLITAAGFETLSRHELGL